MLRALFSSQVARLSQREVRKFRQRLIDSTDRSRRCISVSRWLRYAKQDFLAVAQNARPTASLLPSLQTSPPFNKDRDRNDHLRRTTADGCLDRRSSGRTAFGTLISPSDRSRALSKAGNRCRS